MKRRDFLKTAAAGAAGLAMPGRTPRAGAPAPDDRPNIVIILADDLGYGDPSCCGGWVETPHLDAMAAGGMRFTDFHASCPVCSPTRAGLLTGRYQQRAGIPGVIYAGADRPVHYHGLHTRETTLAEVLKRRGYATGIFGKWHLGYLKKYNPLHHGFDEFVGYVSGNVDYVSHRDHTGRFDWWHGLQRVEEQGYVTRLITRHSLDFIRRHRDRPFCLYVSHEAVHSPFQAPGDNPVRGPDRHKKAADRPRRETYRMMLEELDRGVGRVLETLRELDLHGRTFVFFFSDNGARPPGSNAPYRGRKAQLWEGGHRVPAVAWWPGRVPAGAVCRQPAISIDVMPTALAITGGGAPEDVPTDGVDLSPVLFQGASPGERDLFWEFRSQQAMRRGRWKLVRDLPGHEGVGLYDLPEDPGEQNDLSDRHPQRVERMSAALGDWSRRVNADATPQPDEPPPA